MNKKMILAVLAAITLVSCGNQTAQASEHEVDKVEQKDHQQSFDVRKANKGDSIRIVGLLKEGNALEKNANIVMFYARKFLGKPYVAYTLDQELEERLVINTEGLDCTTYVENVIEANLKACAAPHEAAGEAYNVAFGGREYLIDVYYTLSEAV